MVDQRFFKPPAPMALSALAALTGARVDVAHEQRCFASVAPLENAGPDDLSFLDNVKYIESFTQSRAGACFVREKFAARAPKGMILLVTEEPYTAYARAAAALYPPIKPPAHISPNAHIAATAQIGKDCTIASGVVIGEHAVIGEGCVIGAGSVIGEGVSLGKHCIIGALCVISHSIIGARVVLHSGVHIGQDGFGFAPSASGIVKVPQLGRVIIGDDVDIGSGTCIDRGAGPDTRIGNHSKIDNLVQIGHNVQIGAHVIIAAQSGISGSAIIGDGAMLGGQVGIAGHLRIGRGAKIAAQSGVMTNVPDGQSYGGSPAVPARQWHRQTAALAAMVTKKAGKDE